ncbi:GFA family protein [Albimonas sp. CAU 1670]|uniref:GFA family protein n=1 Tax=Albimonas sp. CAU 1670 TaxID=3032599 RepID=UPI0023DC5674|nr:GFA family protein [Albimonas sp. CAU 1670]MDF2233457.1 GFA family protein [Albimonas sp. CAU 1670]
MTVRTGGCACGAVRYEATGGGPAFGVCHCETCRKWVGGPFVALQVETLTVTQGEDRLNAWRSSEWGERVSCAACGGTLFFKVVPTGEANVALGTLDDAAGLELGMEIFADSKPAAYGFLSDGSKKLTGAEFLKMIGAA